MPPINSNGIRTAMRDKLIEKIVKPISPAPFRAAAIGLFALLNVASYIFQHDDGVVDDEADGNRQRHQRQIVETVPRHPHQRTGAEQRERHGDAGNYGRPDATQKSKDHQYDQNNRDRERELHVLDGGADRLGAVADHLNFDRRRHGGHETRQFGLDAVDGVDDVDAGLFEDDEKHAARAIRPGALAVVLWSSNCLTDVADADRRAAAISDNDVVPGLGADQLIIIIDL